MASIADRLGISGEHELIIGDSFSRNAKASPSFHSIRYDFKPASVDGTKTAAVEVGHDRSVTVTVPHLEGTQQTVYRGSSRPHHKECVLIIDHHTGEVRLEKLLDNIQVKKTRSEGRPRIPAMPRPLTPIDPVARRTSPSRPPQQAPAPPQPPPQQPPPQQPPPPQPQRTSPSQRLSPAPGRRAPRAQAAAPVRRPSPPQLPSGPPAPGSMPLLGVFDDQELPVAPTAPAVAPSAPMVAPSAPTLLPSAPTLLPSAPTLLPSAPTLLPSAPTLLPSAQRPRKPSAESAVGVLSDSDSDSASSSDSDMDVDMPSQPAPPPPRASRRPGGQSGDDPSAPSTNLFTDLQLSDDSD